MKMNRFKINICRLLTIILIIVLIIELTIFIQSNNNSRIKINNRISMKTNMIELNQDLIDFEGFDNINGVSEQIIPNIVHLLYLQQPYIKFYQLVNILSIYYNHKPDFIYIHCDNCNFSGKYFQILRNFNCIWKLIKFYKIPFKKTIFGTSYGWINHHRSDIWRLQLLMNYGGIFLDNDVYVVKSLNEFLNYEMVVSWDEPHSVHGLGVQVLLAHRNARLLKAHFDFYRHNYTRTSWYYNAGHVPAVILRKWPELARIVKIRLGTQNFIHELFKTNTWNEWIDLTTIHLMINHRSYLDEQSPIKEFNETNIWTYDRTYGTMVRIMLRKANLFVPKNNKSIIIENI